MSFPIAVVYKFFDDQGTYLAALLTYYGFVSLFPLLLLLTSMLGFVLQGHPDLQRRILDSAMGQFPLIGDQLREPAGLRGSGVALVLGAAVALYGALGAAQAMQHTMNVVWAVPRNRRPNPLKARLRSLGLIATLGISLLATTVLSAVGSSAGALGVDVSRPLALAFTLIALALNLVVIAVGFRVSTARRLTLRSILPGAMVAALIWQALQFGGSAFVSHVVHGAGSTYGVFAIVLGLLGWIHLASLGIVVGAEANVVREKRLYPRALLTPFTDDVNLTSGDKTAYTDAAASQRFKGFEDIDVEFEHDGQNADANRLGRRAGRRGDAPP